MKDIKESVAIVKDLVKKYHVPNYAYRTAISFKDREDVLDHMIRVNSLNVLLYNYNCVYRANTKLKNGKLFYRVEYDEFVESPPTSMDFLKAHLLKREHDSLHEITRHHLEIENNFEHCMKELDKYELFDLKQDVKYYNEHLPLNVSSSTMINRYLESHSDVITSDITLIVFIYLAKRINRTVMEAIELSLHDEII